MEGFEVRREDKGVVSVLYLKGYLDAHTAPELEESLRKLVQEDRTRIIANFSDLNYISSAGLGVFMGFIEEVREKGGDIKLSNMSPKVFRIFDLLGFPTLYDIVEREEEAISGFGKVAS